MRVSTNWKEVEYKQIILDDDSVVELFYYKDKEKVFCKLYDRRGNRIKSVWMNFRKRDNIDNNIEGIIKKLSIMDY